MKITITANSVGNLNNKGITIEKMTFAGPDFSTIVTCSGNSQFSTQIFKSMSKDENSGALSINFEGLVLNGNDLTLEYNL